tara:strand:+ start:100 stop:363 length:264 start_codon:yes stop_codon:yes gene_type:complete
MKAKMQDQRILQYEATIDLDFGVKSISSDNQKAERNNITMGPNFIIASELLPRFAKSHHPPAAVNNKVHPIANLSTLILCSETTLSG